MLIFADGLVHVAFDFGGNTKDSGAAVHVRAFLDIVIFADVDVRLAESFFTIDIGSAGAGFAATGNNCHNCDSG